MPELAVITGASTGIGLEIARCAAKDGHPLLIAANEAEIGRAAVELEALGVPVEALQVDLSTEAGVEDLIAAIGGRPVDALVANAGTGSGHAFIEQEWSDIREAIDLNVKGTTLLLHRMLPVMLARGEGHILVTGSIAGYMPGAFMAVYNGTKAYLDSITFGIREELKDQKSEVTITCLMPGPTETPFFDRADMRDTNIGESKKADPADVAEAGWEAMKAGKAGMTPGLLSKLQATMAGFLPETLVAQLSRMMAEPHEDKARR